MDDRRKTTPFFYLIASVFFCVVITSACANYPTVPKIEGSERHEEQSPASSPPVINEVSKEKAPPRIPIQEKKEKDYEIGPEDVLEVMVWDHDDLTRELYVSQEGDFSYPLIGKVHAAGLTISQLEEEIKKRLSGRFIINPQVTITVKEYKSKRVFVLGEVGGSTASGQGPGTYPLAGKTTLMDVLSQAGGPTRDAGTEVIIIRPKNAPGNPVSLAEAKKDEIIKVSLKSILEGDPSQNIYLEPNDTIYVSKANYFFVYGEVNKPGRYNLEEGTTILKAITTAGGVTEKAAVNRTKVVREKSGGKTEISVKMNDPVEPEDIIMVPESFF
ncbi:MAG: polysaccharide biosynthesis/export family protein [Deltaproteobacteria bacterium]|nr:polysaccharide biosynthesis/export family protein [Deltaproteobacteria bacterium]